MLTLLQEENLIDYLEELSYGDEVESITLSLEENDYDVYIAQMVSGREYYILYHQQPLSVFAKSSICQNAEDAISLYESIEE